ncbi:hypothetical protein G6F40_016157 [Rhizopus arrhizus]|nr:hypothetical protein G6F40_016157 [Rhizopus arrhizus]
MPTSPEAARICREDLNEVITTFIQDKTAVERGLFDKENTLPEDLTQVQLGKIVPRHRRAQRDPTGQAAAGRRRCPRGAGQHLAHRRGAKVRQRAGLEH